MINNNGKTKNKITLQDRDWKDFRLEDIFNISRGSFKNVSDINPLGNNNIPVITASESNNGVSAYTTQSNNKTYKNAITIANNGSIGSAFYQAGIFTATTDISILSNKFLSIYNSLFITSIIFKEKYRFNYVRKWGIDRMKKSLIKLPVDAQGNPDWQFMEDYIKSLPYSKNLI